MARSVTVATLLTDLADMCDEAPFDATSYITQTQAIRYLSQSVHAFSLLHRGWLAQCQSHPRLVHALHDSFIKQDAC